MIMANVNEDEDEDEDFTVYYVPSALCTNQRLATL